MARTCFVIMPFSETQSCTESEWTWIFENLFKPAVEEAGLDYVCRRSVADRGNIVARILVDLNDAYVVLADLTDRNANVFYELGVRHTLKNRSLMLAQRKEDLPFDLGAYACHVYGWKTQQEKTALVERIRALLREVDTSPERPDNPVSDFLRQTAKPVEDLEAQPLAAIDTVSGHLVPSVEPDEVIAVTRRLAKNGRSRETREWCRLKRSKLLSEFGAAVEELRRKETSGSCKPSDIPIIAKDFISPVEGFVTTVEQFALTSIEEGWQEGVSLSLGFAGSLITLGEKPNPGRNLRFATGLPALFAWRLIILMGAKALAEEDFDILHAVLRHPIEVEESEGRFSHRPLFDRKGLFHPEAFLGHANFAILYLQDLWSNHVHLQNHFESEQNYDFYLAQFLMIVALADAARDSNGPNDILYPGYRLLPQAHRAMSALCSRLANVPQFRESLAKLVLNKNGAELQASWQELAARLNDVPLGTGYWNSYVHFPNSLSEKPKDW